MNEVFLVARREIRARLRTRSFQITTVAMMLIAAGAVFVQERAGEIFDSPPDAIALTPESGALAASLADVAALFDHEVTIQDFPTREAAIEALDAEDVDAVVLDGGTVLYRDEPDPTLTAVISRAAYDATLAQRAEDLGLTLEQARTLATPEAVVEQVLHAAEGEQREDTAAIAFLGSIVLFMAISLYGQWVLVGVVEEKANRVVEVLLATLMPWQMLTGKVFGIVALVMLQIVATGGAYLAGLFTIGDADLPRVTTDALLVSVVWLVLGVILYNFVYAAMGATVSRPEDSSNAASPIMVPTLAGYLAGLIYVPQAPDAPVSVALSLFPLTSPLTMPARFAAGGSSPLEMALAIVLALAGIAGAIYLASQIYSGAILQGRRVGALAAFRRRRDLAG